MSERTGGVSTVNAVQFDVTEQREKEAVYSKWQQSLQERDPNTYTLFQCNLSKNASFDKVEGALLHIDFSPESNTFNGRTQEYVRQCVYPEDCEKYLETLDADSLLAGYYRGERKKTLDYREKLPKGECRWLRFSVELVEYPDSSDVKAYLMYENIDDEKRTELLTLERAETDPLTGVLNRTTFIEKMEHALQASPAKQNALLMLDIDGFKLVNDAFGHAAGDQVLVELAQSLQTTLRRGDLLGRLGGDEFVIFLSDIPGNAVAAKKAQQVCALARKAFSMEVQISASVGITMFPRDGTDFDVLYKKADAALYHVKGSGKDDFFFYHEDIKDEHLGVEQQAGTEVSLQKAKMKRRLLIVDDNKMDFALLANMFKDDFLIEKATGGNSALIRMRHYGSAISAVLLDLMMPDMDGFAVLEKMCSSPEMESIPVVVVSGEEDRETSLRAIRCGAADYVTKPVDADLLRTRVFSAISKAENERLRAQNSYLMLQSSETQRYRTVLERNGTVVVEEDWIAGTFSYDPLISTFLAGTYDERNLWHIFLSDMVADTAAVKRLQELVHSIAGDRKRMDGSTTVQLKTPDGTVHWFLITVYKLVNEFNLADKLILTFNDLGKTRPEDGISKTKA